MPHTAAHQSAAGQGFGEKIHMQTPAQKKLDSASPNCLAPWKLLVTLLQRHYRGKSTSSFLLTCSHSLLLQLLMS